MDNAPTQKDNYFKWLAHQINGWGLPNYGLFLVSLAIQLYVLFTAPITLISIITFIGVNLGVACICSINAVRPINGVLGIVSALCFMYVGFVAKNYLSILEQLAYVATLDLPVLIGKNKWDDNSVNEVKSFGAKQWATSIFWTLVVWGVSSFLINYLTAEPRPIIDGLSFAVCLTAGIICYKKYNNQYFWWLFAGLMQVALWFVTFRQGGATIAMFLSASVYVANDVIAFAYSPWFHKNKRNKVVE